MKRWIQARRTFGSVARLPCGAATPGRYLPVSTPWAMRRPHDLPHPQLLTGGNDLASITRHSIEYCGWLDTSWKPSSLASVTPARSCSAVHSETPM